MQFKKYYRKARAIGNGNVALFRKQRVNKIKSKWTGERPNEREGY